MNIGIDIGSAYTVVYYTNSTGHLRPLEFENGKVGAKYLLPSCYTEFSGDVFVGQAALDVYSQNPHFAQLFGYDTENVHGKRDDVLRNILTEIKKELTVRFGNSDHSALVAVGCEGDECLCEDILKVLYEVGFKDNSIIYPPVAEAITYSRELNGNVLIADFGESSLELAVVHACTAGQITDLRQLMLLGRHTCTDISGKYVDNQLVEWVQNNVNIPGKNYKVNINNHSGYVTERVHDIKASATVREYISDICGLKSKLYATGTKKADMYICGLYEDLDLDLKLTEEDYYKLVGDNFRAHLANAVETVLKNSGIKQSDISGVIVTGGMARELNLTLLLDKLFAKRVKVAKDTMTAAAIGAAICHNNARFPVATTAYSNLAIVIGNNCDYILRRGEYISDFNATRNYCLNVAGYDYFELLLTECPSDDGFDVNKHPLIKKEVRIPAAVVSDEVVITIEFRFVEINVLEAIISFDGSQDKRREIFVL